MFRNGHICFNFYILFNNNKTTFVATRRDAFSGLRVQNWFFYFLYFVFLFCATSRWIKMYIKCICGWAPLADPAVWGVGLKCSWLSAGFEGKAEEKDRKEREKKKGPKWGKEGQKRPSLPPLLQINYRLRPWMTWSSIGKQQLKTFLFEEERNSLFFKSNQLNNSNTNNGRLPI